MTDERSGGQAREREARGRRRLVGAFAAVVLVAGAAAGVAWWTGGTTDLEQEPREEVVEHAVPDAPASPTEEPVATVPETEAPLEEVEEEPELPPTPTWSRVPHDDDVFGGPERLRMTGVAAGAAGLVAVGGDDGREAAAVWTSPDGEDWSRLAHDEDTFGGPDRQRMNDVAVGDTGFVAVGNDLGRGAGAVWTSPDGQDWTRRVHDEATFGGPGNQVMLSVSTAGSGFVAVGGDRGREAAAIWTSPDGEEWRRVAHDEEVLGGPEAQLMLSVTEGEAGLVAVGNDADAVRVWSSPDGDEWSRAAHDEDVLGGTIRPLMSSVVAAGPGFVAGGHDPLANDAAVWTSPDGQSWSRVECEGLDASGPQSMRALAEGGPGLVAVGRDDAAGTAAVWTSTDGQAWDRVEDEALARPGTGMEAVTEGEAGLVAVGYDDGDEGGAAAVWIAD